MKFPTLFSAVESDLASIIAPLSSIKEKLVAFIAATEEKIKEKKDVIELHTADILRHEADKLEAAAVHKNITALITPQPSIAVPTVIAPVVTQ
jgi:hypothetical protein